MTSSAAYRSRAHRGPRDTVRGSLFFIALVDAARLLAPARVLRLTTPCQSAISRGGDEPTRRPNLARRFALVGA
jgi:hypothetical protein